VAEAWVDLVFVGVKLFQVGKFLGVVELSSARKKEVEVSARWWWCQFVRFQLFVTVLCIERGNTFMGCLGIAE
jgi:hypothetical protein